MSTGAAPTRAAEIPVVLSVVSEMMAHVAPDLDSATPLLGRDRELAHLVEHLGIEASARSRAVLLAGDAGVGKTRVLAELISRAEAAGWGTAVGHCLDFGDSALPYLPFSELFGRLDHHDADLSRRVVETVPALQHLQPGRPLGHLPLPAADGGQGHNHTHGPCGDRARWFT